MNPTPTIFSRAKNYIQSHKILSFIGLVIIILIIYWIVKAANPASASTTYVVGQATTGTIVSTVTGTGQVSTSSNLAITPQNSGAITDIRVKPGDKVSKGTTLFVIDTTNAEKSVRDAKINLASANLSLASAQASTQNTQSTQSTSVATAYNNLLNSSPEAVASDYATAGYTAPTISGNYTLGKEGSMKISLYTSESGFSFNVTGLVNASGIVSSVTPQPIGGSGLYIVFPSKVSSNLTWTITLPNTSAANYLSNYNNYQTALQNQSETNDQSGVTSIDLASKQLAVLQAQNALTDAETTLSNCYVTAPFDGVVASVPVIVGQQASSGTTLATLISNQEITNISLNEVDVANVKIGDKATMTFDAISGLTITGKVIEIDTVGTVSQGVVSYNVQIAFDTQDPHVKSGMSVTADIATAVEQNVVTIPTTAVKTNGDISYVLTVPAGTPVSVGNAGEALTGSNTPVMTTVTTGISDDLDTEILSGLSTGDEIVTKTIVTAAGAKTATTTAPSILGSIGGGRSITGTRAGTIAR